MCNLNRAGLQMTTNIFNENILILRKHDIFNHNIINSAYAQEYSYIEEGLIFNE